jgi:nucleoside-diphosphate-sugar epimerase
MRLLILGGTRFVGRAIVEVALNRGDDVAVLTRGESGTPAPGVEWIRGDRADPSALAPVTRREWDAVIDTWSGTSDVVESTAAQLAASARWYGYVSSRSVYEWPMVPGSDESARTVDPTTASDAETSYAIDKRRSELAVLAHFDGRCMLARARLVLGPYEDVGRLTWWLSRAAAGGSLVAPGPRDRIWQYIDARDLAAFMLHCADRTTAGMFNVVCPRDHGVTTERLLTCCAEVTGANTQLRWVDSDVLTRARVGEWDDLPGWTSPDGELAGLHDCDVTAAVAAGLSCRAIEDTVGDTWNWLREIPPRRRPPRRADVPRRGLTAEQEQAIWWLAAPR